MSNQATLTSQNMEELRKNTKITHVECLPCGKMLEEADRKMCARCKSIWYCSAACQKEHWPKHRTQCTQRQKDAQAIYQSTGVDTYFRDYEAWKVSSMFLLGHLAGQLFGSKDVADTHVLRVRTEHTPSSARKTRFRITGQPEVVAVTDLEAAVQSQVKERLQETNDQFQSLVIVLNNLIGDHTKAESVHVERRLMPAKEDFYTAVNKDSIVEWLNSDEFWR